MIRQQQLDGIKSRVIHRAGQLLIRNGDTNKKGSVWVRTDFCQKEAKILSGETLL